MEGGVSQIFDIIMSYFLSYEMLKFMKKNCIKSSPFFFYLNWKLEHKSKFWELFPLTRMLGLYAYNFSSKSCIVTVHVKEIKVKKNTHHRIEKNRHFLHYAKCIIIIPKVLISSVWMKHPSPRLLNYPWVVWCNQCCAVSTTILKDRLSGGMVHLSAWIHNYCTCNGILYTISWWKKG